MKILKYLIKSHKFFVKETPSYVAGHREKKYVRKDGFRWVSYDFVHILTFKEKMYYPIAYCKFMSYCLKDSLRN